MRLLSLYLIILAWFLLFTSCKLSAQVTLSPEVGISYLPFKFVGANRQTYSEKGNLMFGLSAQLPLYKKWHISTRMSYANRENITWVDLCLCPGYKYNRYEQSDINLDLSAHFLLNDYLHIGIGPSIIRKIKTNIIFLDTLISPEEVYLSENRFEYGVQAIVSYHTKFIALKLEYTRKLYNYQLDRYILRGRNRFNLVVSAPISLGRKRN